MKLMCKRFLFGLAVTAAAIGCSSNQSTGGKGLGTAPGEANGKIGLNLTLAGGEVIPSLSFTLQNGTAADTITGTITLPTSTAGTGPFAVPTFEIIPVVPATGYWITLTGASADGTVTCSGSDPATLPVSTTNPGFAVTAGNETVVPVLVTCVSSATSGTVEVNPTIQNCPTVQSLTAINATANTTAPGNTATIFAAAAAPNPAGLTYTFSITKGTGTLSGQVTATGNASSNILFTCPTTGETDTIQVVTSDQVGATCLASLTTASVTVTCGTPACQGVGSGTEATPDTAAGTCPTGQSNTLKDTAGNFCCAATPCFGIGTGVEATPDTAAGTCPTGQFNSGTAKDAAGNFCCSTAALSACTSATQPNCVKCQGNSTGICSPTEADFVNYDVANKVVTAAGNDTAASCYSCLLGGGCLDDTEFGDTGHECEDTTPAFAGGTTTAECQAVISCILGSGVGTTQCASAAVSGCYCGTAGVSTACQGNPAAGPINGACATQISTGLDFGLTDGTDNTKNLTDTTKAGGRATQIFQCAQSNGCSACL
jgi:hypothetical protein